jgi:hypothetical protein|tara:strand:+ start:1017 stop:1259 length:243 start_codon:yes stop_codon:yes gene_type:complete
MTHSTLSSQAKKWETAILDYAKANISGISDFDLLTEESFVSQDGKYCFMIIDATGMYGIYASPKEDGSLDEGNLSWMKLK